MYVSHAKIDFYYYTPSDTVVSYSTLATIICADPGLKYDKAELSIDIVVAHH